MRKPGRVYGEPSFQTGRESNRVRRTAASLRGSRSQCSPGRGGRAEAEEVWLGPAPPVRGKETAPGGRARGPGQQGGPG